MPELSPEEARQEQELSIAVAKSEVSRAKEEGLPLDATFVEKAAKAVHEAWVLRNRGRVEKELVHDTIEEKEKRRRELGPYEELLEEEREQDRAYVRNAIEEGT